MRLDKMLANMGFGSRKDVRKMIKKGYVTVNGEVIRDQTKHINHEHDVVQVNDETVTYQKYIYLMMNKPPEYVSATKDAFENTVIDLLPYEYQLFDPFPVGRLDKDTVGLLLITNDGQLAHQLTSPKKGIEKTYFAKITGQITSTHIEQFQRGITLDDGYETKPAQLQVLKSAEISEVELTITEGKFHQVKRMFLALGKKVIYLKRIRMGKIVLDESLPQGAVRELTEKEYAYCQSLRS